MVDKVLFSSNTEEWGTPLNFYAKLDSEFHFDTDPCTTVDNPLQTRVFYTKEDNGLERRWYGNVFINPPYGKNVGNWVRESRHRQLMPPEPEYHKIIYHKNIVMLLPSRTDVAWFHENIWDSISNKPKSNIEIRFIKGRLTFVGAHNPAPFPSMLVIFRR